MSATTYFGELNKTRKVKTAQKRAKVSTATAKRKRVAKKLTRTRGPNKTKGTVTIEVPANLAFPIGLMLGRTISA